MRWIEIAVDPSVDALRVEMHAHAMIPAEWVVPVVAPDTVPPGFYAAANIRAGSACITGRMLRGIVVVTFKAGTTQAQKQEAIELIEGQVVGGIRSRDDIEGYYYVRVEDDPEGRILCEAVETLNALPQVGYASESLFATAFYRKPNEEEQWTRDKWQVDPAAVQFSQRWGLERIAAPLGWARSTGDVGSCPRPARRSLARPSPQPVVGNSIALPSRWDLHRTRYQLPVPSEDIGPTRRSLPR